MTEALTKLTLPKAFAGSRYALTSVPWPGDRGDAPRAMGVASQTVPLFEPKLRPRLRRYLLLTESAEGLPAEVRIDADGDMGETPMPRKAQTFSSAEVKTLGENLDRNVSSYVWRECEARIAVGAEACICYSKAAS